MKIDISESEYRDRCDRMEEFVCMRFPPQILAIECMLMLRAIYGGSMFTVWRSLGLSLLLGRCDQVKWAAIRFGRILLGTHEEVDAAAPIAIDPIQSHAEEIGEEFLQEFGRNIREQ